MLHPIVTTIAVLIVASIILHRLYTRWQTALNITKRTIPVSVNYHFTRKCNKTCTFCFHTEKTSFVASEADMKRGLHLLKQAGMRKINFAGVAFGLESVSIISNGTKITEKWLRANGKYIDVMGVSCDSFNEQTNIDIGRGSGENVTQLFRIREWCHEMGIKFKLNTVVCKLNWEEDMAEIVQQLDPFRWKVFQVLAVGGENDASEVETALDKRKRDARKLLISTEQFEDFCRTHKHLKCFVPESNELMAASYLILDEYLCFLDKSGETETQSSSILTVGVQKALEEVKWDEVAFKQRGGLCYWAKDVTGSDGSCGGGPSEGLDW